MTRLRVLLVAAGIAGMGYAATGLLTDPGVQLGGVLIFLVAVLVLHDGVWMPLVLLAGRLRRVNRVLFICGASLAVVGLPLALGPGDALPYARNLALLLGALILAGAAVAVIRKKFASPPGDPDG